MAREFRSVLQHLPPKVFAKIKRTKWHHFKWKGLTLMKDPMSLSIYLQLLQDLRPATILEFGTFDGGSALWMEDMLSVLHIACDLHTFDIDAERVKLPPSSKVHFHHLDCRLIATYARDNDALFQGLEHPVLVIEDCHENVLELLQVVDRYLQEGDYLVVEDTLDKSKHDLLLAFLEGGPYDIDDHYCDFWGHNNSWNVNSFLRKGPD